jgi:hypothetical protein
MSVINRTPLTGVPLEQPEPPPLRKFALYGRDHPCVEHHAHYTGTVPCTGVLRCTFCGTEWDPETGVLLNRTKTGRVLSDADVDALADEAERGYDVAVPPCE